MLGRNGDLRKYLPPDIKYQGLDIAPEFAPVRAGDIRRSVADIARARAALGYAPAFTLEQGLAQLIGSYRGR